MRNLALKYRPQTFDQIVGQEHVTTILTALIKKEAIPCGVLFQGSRGTGKTSTARILAAALNCDNTTRPCRQCVSCIAIQDERSDSVLEVDAASHGLVDDIRTLREAARYSHSGKYRVFIIDEAHMLSKAASNALLKILEEPPEDVLFIFATTEPSKIIETIRSRLMPFEFHRLSQVQIVKQLKYIAEQEGLQIDDELLPKIAAMVDGGMRDAIISLEQLCLYGADAQSFDELFGVVSRDIYAKLIAGIFAGKHEDSFALVVEYFMRTGEGSLFLKGFAEYFKDILMGVKGVSVDVPEEIIKKFTMGTAIKAMHIIWGFLAQKSYASQNHSVLATMFYCELLDILVPQKAGVGMVKEAESAGSVLRRVLG